MDDKKRGTHTFAAGDYWVTGVIIVEETQREIHGVKTGDTVFKQRLETGTKVQFYRYSSDGRSVWFKQQVVKDDITYYRIDVAVAQAAMAPA